MDVLGYSSIADDMSWNLQATDADEDINIGERWDFTRSRDPFRTALLNVVGVSPCPKFQQMY